MVVRASSAILETSGLLAPALVDGLFPPRPWHSELARLGCVSLHTNHRHLTAQLASAIKGAGSWLFCYTVNSPQRARTLLGWGVDAFCTDAIDRIPARFAAGD